MAEAWLSLGSNLEPIRNLEEALASLRERFGPMLESGWYASRAVGFEGPEFINLAVGIETSLARSALDAYLHELEARQGRDRTQPKLSSRTLDIDIVVFETHPEFGSLDRARLREDLRHTFVLRPLVDIAPELVPPDGDPRRLAQRWQELMAVERASVRRVTPGPS